MKRIVITLGVALFVSAFALTVSADSVSPITVDGVEYQATKVSGSAVHYETPTPNPQAAFTERNIWTGHGSENLPCEGGIHWIDNKNVLTISHCLESTTTTTTLVVSTTTTPEETTTTQPPSTTTTTVIETTTTTIGEVTTSVPPTTSSTVVVTTGPTPTLPETGADGVMVAAAVAMGLLIMGVVFLSMFRGRE